MSFDALIAFATQSPILSSIFVVLTVALVYTEVARLFVGYKTVSPAQLTDLINRESALLVDVSAIAEFEKGHILGAKHAVVCRTGQSSSEAAKRLHKAGFTRVYWLNDGLNAWIQADLPLTKGR
jgi:rhodanese-related sulfurtransferase